MKNPNFSFEKTDICDAKAITDIFDRYKPSGMMHLAAESHVDRSIDGPEQFIQTNIVGTYRLLQASREYVDRTGNKDSFRFLHVSTDEVFGSLGADDPGFNESTPYDPHSPYSASKAASDHLVRAWGDTYGLPILVTNCSNNYGPYQFPEKLIPVIILKALSGQSIPVYGKGENVRDCLYATDHCDALFQIVKSGRDGEIHNIGGNNEQTNLDIVKKSCSIMGTIRRPVENREAQTISFCASQLRRSIALQKQVYLGPVRNA